MPTARAHVPTETAPCVSWTGRLILPQSRFESRVHRGDVVEVLIDLRPEPWVGVVEEVKGKARSFPLSLYFVRQVARLCAAVSGDKDAHALMLATGLARCLHLLRRRLPL